MTMRNGPSHAFASWSSSEPSHVGQYCIAFANAVVMRVAELDCASFCRESDEDIANHLRSADTACWNPSFGMANYYAKQGEGGSRPAAGQLFLALAEFGFEGEFVSQYRFPVRHRLGARLLPIGKSFRMRSADRTITVANEDSSTTVHLDEPQAIPEVAAGVFGKGLMRWGYAVDPFILEPGDLPLDLDANEAAMQQLRDARDLIEIDPRAADWCSRLLHELSLTNSKECLRLTSRSSPIQPGNIQLSVPGPAVHIAELLVHEAAHQHYFLASLAGSPIASKGHGITAYSALRECERPVDRILLGLHALINIVEFLDVLSQSGGNVAAEAEARIVELTPTIRSMTSPFALDPEILSETGRGLLGDGLERLDVLLDGYAGQKRGHLTEARA